MIFHNDLDQMIFFNSRLKT